MEILSRSITRSWSDIEKESPSLFAFLQSGNGTVIFVVGEARDYAIVQELKDIGFNIKFPAQFRAIDNVEDEETEISYNL